MSEKAQTIFRVEKNKDNPFVMIDRRVIENPKLSWKAKGLLAYLLSRPDDWVVRFKDLVKRAPDGGHTVRVAMKELKDAGHVRITTERQGGKVVRWVYTVYESPLVEFQQVETPQVENRTFNNNELNNKDSERDTAIFAALSELTGGGLNSDTPRLVDGWKNHPLERVLQAIEIAKSKHARSAKYVDEILIGWEANGYPKTREEKVNARRSEKPQAVDPVENWLLQRKAEVQNG